MTWKTILNWAGILFGLYVLYSMIFACGCEPREKARQTACLSNERQLGLGLAQYAQDFDGQLPAPETKDGTATWRKPLFDDVSSSGIYSCPDHVTGTGPDGYLDSYALIVSPSGLFPSMTSGSLPLSSVKDPQRLILLCDASGNGPAIDLDSASQDPWLTQIWAGHTHGANFVFADGHARWMRPADTDGVVVKPGDERINLWYIDGTRPLSPGAVWHIHHPASGNR